MTVEGEMLDAARTGKGFHDTMAATSYLVSARLWKSRRLLSYVASMAAVALLAGGCAAPRIGSSSQAHRGRVFCLRGLFDVFSLGLNVHWGDDGLKQEPPGRGDRQHDTRARNTQRV